VSVRIEIPAPLREHTGGQVEVQVEGTTVAAALQSLITAHPSIGPKIFDNGRLRPNLNIFVNDEDIRYLDELQTAVADGQLLALIPAVAGG
jgi:molybdopterin converting factor small subunit